MNDYTPNSHKYKAEQKQQAAAPSEKKITPADIAPVKVKKKSELSKIGDIFIAEDIGNVKEYLTNEILIPAMKNLFSDIFVGGLDMLINGKRRGSRSSSVVDNISYNRYFKDRGGEPPEPRDRDRYDPDTIVFTSRGDAEKVLMMMEDILNTYSIVTVADLFEITKTPGAYTNHRYGWTSLRSAYVDRARGGYVIRFPKAAPID